jgi:hypothetical protein
MARLVKLLLVVLLALAPAGAMAAPCWMKPATEPALPCHQPVTPAEPCHHLTVADCAGPQMFGVEAPQLAKAQLIGVEYTLPTLQPQSSLVQPMMGFMSQAPPSNTRQLLSILLTTQRYLI